LSNWVTEKSRKLPFNAMLRPPAARITTEVKRLYNQEDATSNNWARFLINLTFLKRGLYSSTII
jgi:hypothetical protein